LRFRFVTFAAGAVALALASGCGGGTNDGSDAGVGPSVGAPINLADCTDWENSSVEERLGTIRQIREFNGADVPGTSSAGPTLDDQKAYDLFDDYCSNDFARAFKLYKLYGRAAAFSGVEIPDDATTSTDAGQ
jgi:hypothetical protein